MNTEQLKDLIRSFGYTTQAQSMEIAQALEAALTEKQEPEHTGCACRWDKDDNRVATCVRHQGWLDVVSEWADRAKEAEAKLTHPATVNQALLETLKWLDIWMGHRPLYECIDKVRAALAQAEGNV